VSGSDDPLASRVTSARFEGLEVALNAATGGRFPYTVVVPVIEYVPFAAVKVTAPVTLIVRFAKVFTPASAGEIKVSTGSVAVGSLEVKWRSALNVESVVLSGRATRTVRRNGTPIAGWAWFDVR
jgi:hypothetical protein